MYYFLLEVNFQTGEAGALIPALMKHSTNDKSAKIKARFVARKYFELIGYNDKDMLDGNYTGLYKMTEIPEVDFVVMSKYIAVLGE